MDRWNVHTGRPSWHQAKAGHISAGCTSFTDRQAADRYADTYRRNHPDDPCFVQEVK
jgi:hypothetical protein